MRHFFPVIGVGVALCAAAYAQGSRVVVPPRDTARPRLVKVTALHSSITVRTHAGQDVIVETGGGSGHGLPDTTPDGLHRIDLPRGASVSEDGSTVNIQAPLGGEPMVITVPVNTSLQLHSVHGPIRVEGVHGEVDATCTHGSIDLSHISGTVVADATHGSIHADMDAVDPSKPLSFASTHGDLDVTLPADLKANFKVRSFNGTVTTDFEMKLPAGQPLIRRGATAGAVNGGGVEASFSTFNGKITIHKK